MDMKDLVQWQYLQELSKEDQARLVNVKGEWMGFKQDLTHKFFIKKLDGKLIICDEYLEKAD